MPSPVPTPHDQFFRAVFGQQPLAADFLGHYLPARIVRQLDLAKLTPRPGSFVDDDLHIHHSDLLYEVRLRDGSSGLVYILFEHKSSPERRVAVQLLRYVVRVWEHDARDRKARQGSETEPNPRLVVPIVIYHGTRRWTAPRALGDLYTGPRPLRPYWPQLRYALVDLGRLPDADIVGQAALRVALLVMRSIFDPDLGQRLPAILAPLRAHPTPLGMLQVVMQYIVQANDRVTTDDVAAALAAVDADGGGTDMPTLAQQWVEQGRAEGRVEGRVEGLVEGLHAAIADALDVRFGAEAAALAMDVRTVTDARTLRAILRSVWQVATLDEARQAVREV